MDKVINKRGVRLHYRYSLVWVIFWIIVFFPVALTLLITGSSFEYNGQTHIVNYNGSRFWLCFWIVVFFPIAFLLLFINGTSLTSIQ